ncbi:hypothetical protein J2Z83_003550 [Virgibacillus natechei]|uniref:Histone deacetylase n=1 Tax=Virgibacillus natechei TaxID=1216297 RepID=A0ABS4ILW1_9BACI|nr:hypothetical protein [Virgibacillus natechei]MBP1971411.1 hypothetical protein [Virgibacillus natechei]UZD12222.1 hypothetical protein OLD84_14985 [Virgibacillus natechei]
MDVWYVSFGSNIFQERFLCYINGDRPHGSTKKETGCEDKTPPKASEKVELAYPLYFSKERSKWGEGGVAFIGHETMNNTMTIGRKYLITDEQFIEVVAQENNQYDLDIDLHDVIEKGHKSVNSGWYGRLVYLGDKDGYPMFTFTSNQPIDDTTFTKPSAAYLSTITSGLLELGLSKDGIVEYFLNKNGIEENFTKEALTHYLFS